VASLSDCLGLRGLFSGALGGIFSGRLGGAASSGELGLFLPSLT
jgi:hypothetical protein